LKIENIDKGYALGYLVLGIVGEAFLKRRGGAAIVNVGSI
jgi:hypothetical protein